MRERDFSNEKDTWPPRGILDISDEESDGEPQGDQDRDRTPQRSDEFVIRLPGYRDEL